MFHYRRKNFPYLLSVSLHVILLAIFWFVNFSLDYEEEEFVTIGFGTYGRSSSTGVVSDDKKEEVKPPEIKEKEEPKEEKKVELPKVENTDDENVIAAADKKDDEVDDKKEEIEPLVEEEEAETDGKEFEDEGEGNYGFEIDFGGKGKRKIYSYNLPSYPEGVSKEIDVKLRFTIMPDGSVGRIFPLIKADTRLEMAAINSLRQWRFEPIPNSKKQSAQTAIIVFPYRLQ